MIPWSLLNEVPEHMAQEFSIPIREQGIGRVSSMKFLSTWLRNADNHPCHAHTCLLNEVPEHMAQESPCEASRPTRPATLLNEVPEHMAQE